MQNTRKAFPQGGRTWEDIQTDMRARSADDVDWREGRTPLFVFYNDQQTYEIGRKAYFEFFSENALGRKRAFFSIASMESDVLDFGLSLFNAPQGATGAFTSGGSESIFLAMKAARDAHREAKGISRSVQLNVVMPITAHPAFDKAADAMDLDLRRARLSSDCRVEVEAMRPLIDENTIALIGSAPCFPHGVVDPIEEISQLAEEAGVWLHVDACVGGWMAPFFTRIGRSTPDFDFRFPAVRSISADLHKFGFCPKPASTVFYRDAADLERAAFSSNAWPNGHFSTPTLAGTRPGGAVAGAWAVLNHLGTEGYVKAARRLASMTDQYVAGIEAIDGLEVWAKPDLSIINFGSKEFDIFVVAEKMANRGWLSALTNEPKGMHAMMSLLHEPVREKYIDDLRDCVNLVRKADPQTSDLSAIY